MGQTATLKKISTQLNLSISTVSRALKNHPDISDKTKRKVKELAALMEYEPNSYAINLRTNKSKVLGLIVPDISNLFYDSFISAAEKGARKSGYSLMILQSGDDPVQEAENLKLCKHYRVDGILICLSPNSFANDLLVKYSENGVSVLCFDKIPSASGFDTVSIADEDAATLAANTIIRYNRKKVLGLFGNPELSISKKRSAAFLSVLEKEKSVKPEILYCSNTSEAMNYTRRAIEAKVRPDHIFCMSDEILIGVMKVLKKSTLRIPADISVLAMSNGFIPGLLTPEVTYIETSGYELGHLAIKRMLENLEEQSAPKTIVLPPRLVEGESM